MPKNISNEIIKKDIDKVLIKFKRSVPMDTYNKELSLLWPQHLPIDFRRIDRIVLQNGITTVEITNLDKIKQIKTCIMEAEWLVIDYFLEPILDISLFEGINESRLTNINIKPLILKYYDNYFGLNEMVGQNLYTELNKIIPSIE